MGMEVWFEYGLGLAFYGAGAFCFYGIAWLGLGERSMVCD